MENQEKLFDRFKKAAESSASGEFPSVEKVWSRVEDKLDKKVLTRQHNLWKKTAIGVSVLLFATIGYQILKPQAALDSTENKVVVADPPAIPAKPEEQKTDLPTRSQPSFKPSANHILHPLPKTPAVIAKEQKPAIESAPEGNSEPESEPVLKGRKVAAPSVRPAKFEKGEVFDALGVQREAQTSQSPLENSTDARSTGNAQAPLVIRDGKAITGAEALKITSVSEGIAQIDPHNEKEIVVLNDPLYIINGHYYTEPELFGANPTSPYAPLNQQEIETITVFQGQKAIANYGKRGEKGVVVITTKDRKPASKK